MGRNGEKADCNLQTNREGGADRPTHIYRAAQKVCLGFGDCPQILATCERAEWQGIHRSAFRQLMQLLYVSFLESRTSLFVHLCIHIRTDIDRPAAPAAVLPDCSLFRWHQHFHCLANQSKQGVQCVSLVRPIDELMVI